MNVAGCLLANEQLVTIRIACGPGGRSGEKFQVLDLMEIEIFFVGEQKGNPAARAGGTPSRQPRKQVGDLYQ